MDTVTAAAEEAWTDLMKASFGMVNTGVLAFHREMCRVSGNQIVLALWEAIARHIRIIFGRSIDVDASPRFLHEEHQRLYDLLKTGDADAVTAEIRCHLRPTRLDD